MPETKTIAQRPPQHQPRQPGLEEHMTPRPESHDPEQRESGKLREKVALITGGDSGIGRAVAVAYAKEGADVVIVYLNEHADAEKTKATVEEQGRRCLVIAGDVGNERFCHEAVERTVQEFGHLDILVNNAERPIKAARNCWITPRPKGRSWLSPAHSRKRWPTNRSG